MNGGSEKHRGMVDAVVGAIILEFAKIDPNSYAYR